MPQKSSSAIRDNPFYCYPCCHLPKGASFFQVSSASKPEGENMFDPETNTVIDRLERARRWWKSLALGALTILFVVFSIGVATIIFQRKQIQMEQERTEQALREAEDQSKQARRALYYHQISLAEREWATTR
jgi:hypothetical protein